MKIAATIQARMGSERLYGKVLKPILGKPMLAYMVERLQRISQLSQIIIVTTTAIEDDPIVDLAKKLNITYYRGSEKNVLSRVLSASEAHQVDTILQSTGDCPLIDPTESEKVLNKFLEGSYDYVSNILTRTYPRGMETQVFTRKTLTKVNQLTKNPVDQEHVSYFIYNNPEIFKLGVVTAPLHLQKPRLRLTVDTPDDFKLIQTIIEKLYPNNPSFTLEDILHFLDAHPELYQINSHIHQKVAV